jgi:hypothetical protein
MASDEEGDVIFMGPVCELAMSDLPIRILVNADTQCIHVLRNLEKTAEWARQFLSALITRGDDPGPPEAKTIFQLLQDRGQQALRDSLRNRDE